MRYDPHVGDPELLLAAEGELREGRLRAVRRHLQECARCRARSRELEHRMAQYAEEHREVFVAARPRALPPPAAAVPRYAIGAVLIVAAIGILLTFLRSEPRGPLPDSRLTPGAARLTSKEEVCRLPARDEEQVVPTELAHRVFLAYRIAAPQPRTVEVDHLITPALGGASDIRNLWPQPYASGVWTSRVKDALEDYLRTLVCQGGADLPTVQKELAGDWIAAYRKYFQSEIPLEAHAAFVKDRPWE